MINGQPQSMRIASNKTSHRQQNINLDDLPEFLKQNPDRKVII